MVWREDVEELGYGVIEVLLEEKPCPLDAVIKARWSVFLNSCALANLTEYQDLMGEQSCVCVCVRERVSVCVCVCVCVRAHAHESACVCVLANLKACLQIRFYLN